MVHCGERSKNQYTVRMKNLLFLTGASGSGKTATVEKLERDNADGIVFIHTDDFGVPSPEEMVRIYGGGNGFQRHILNHWINYAKINLSDASALIVEGSLKPSIIIEGCKEQGISVYKMLLFDCDDTTRTERLNHREQPDIATPDMMDYAHVLRSEASENNITIIDTTRMTLDEMVATVIKHMQSASDAVTE